MLKGLSVYFLISLHVSMISFEDNGCPPNEPNPPAFETVLVRFTEDRPPPNGPCTIGYSIPKSLVNFVLFHISFCCLLFNLICKDKRGVLVTPANTIAFTAPRLSYLSLTYKFELQNEIIVNEFITQVCNE